MINFLVVDIETLDEKPPAALIELGWESVAFWPKGVPLLGNAIPTAAPGPEVEFGELSGSMLFGLPEGQVMTPANRAIHHIDPAELRDLPVFDMREWLDRGDDTEYVVAHNSAFEEQWLDFGLPWICTYKCALRAWPDAPTHSNQGLKYWLGHEDSPDFYPPHRALPDAKVTARTLYRLLLEHPPEVLVQWTKEPKSISKMPFGKHKGSLLKDLPGDYLEWVAGPKCEAAEEALKHSCQAELDRRRAERSPFAPAAAGYDERNPPPPEGAN